MSDRRNLPELVAAANELSEKLGLGPADTEGKTKAQVKEIITGFQPAVDALAADAVPASDMPPGPVAPVASEPAAPQSTSARRAAEKASPYFVADGKSITTQHRGIQGPGDPVSAADFAGGDEALVEWVEKEVIKKR